MKKKTLEQQVYGEILQQIMMGTYTPGTHLTEKMLTDQLKASRTPIRRALSRLVAEGVLKHENHCGVIVQDFRVSVKDYMEMLEIRVQFFKMSIQKAQRKQILFNIPALHQSIETFKHAVATDDMNLYYQQLSRFHVLLLLPAKNELALTIMRDLEKKFRIGGSHQFIYELWKPIRSQIVERTEIIVLHLEHQQFDEALYVFEEITKEIVQFLIW